MIDRTVNRVRSRGSRLWETRWYWTAVLGFLVIGLLWMVGLSVWEYKKMPQKNKSILFAALGLFILGIWLVLYVVMVSLLSGSDPELAPDSGSTVYSLVIASPYLFPSIYLFVFYALHARMANRLGNCCRIIRDGHIRSVRELSSIMGVRDEQIVRDVRKLSETGALPGAWVDEKTGMVEFKKSVWAKQKVNCESCGAALVVDFGHTLICEYCGGKLQYK